ncbi:MAG: alpha/beta fold hydrolase [Thermoleophilia bacterium]
MRRTGPPDGLPVVCLSGGRAEAVPGDWGGSMELLVGRLAPRFPGVRFHEVRYRVKSWNVLDSCIADARAALDLAHDPRGRPTLLIGFSMGGAVAIGAAGHPDVAAVVGLAPWIPDRLSLAGLRGRRLAVIQGSLDGWLPGVPGIRPASSRRGWRRAVDAGVPATYELIRGAVHPIALRAPWGLVPMPRAGEWERRVAAQVARFRAEAAQEGEPA